MTQYLNPNLSSKFVRENSIESLKDLMSAKEDKKIPMSYFNNTHYDFSGISSESLILGEDGGVSKFVLIDYYIIHPLIIHEF